MIRPKMQEELQHVGPNTLRRKVCRNIFILIPHEFDHILPHLNFIVEHFFLAMAKVASKYGIELTFFHGKGGTLGRGGNPALYRAILSHPPNTINGRFRVTEQGEMIRQNFGTKEIGERSLDIYTAALLRESFTKRVEPKQEWRDEMDRISEASCAAYRHTVREDPRFVPYFRQATPELELGLLNIGSRPAKRNPKGGVESLRAIPWTFAWAQSRMHLSAWLGVETLGKVVR